MEEQSNIFIEENKNKIYDYFVNHKKLNIVFVFVFILLVILVQVFVAPFNFPTGSVFEISQGQSLQSITVNLHDKNVIRSELVFRSLVIMFGGEKKVIAGDYLLEKKQGAFSLAKRFVSGRFDINSKKITIPEGWNVFQIADYLAKNIVQFDKNKFLQLAKDKEGYLFPDTYFVPGSVNPDEVIKMMQDNFTKKVGPMQDLIFDSKHTEKEIITMASILEEEAMPKDRSTVAGILWKRLSIDMPLQVDSTFSYINGKNTYDLTLDDLQIDSPYNTYKYKGLPPGPISNPGVEAILSALNPVKTDYLYFLTEKDGTIHYAKTFEQHKKNKELYIK